MPGRETATGRIEGAVMEEIPMALNHEEKIYKGIYRNNPGAYGEPINCWEQFITDYFETAGEEIALPEEPPSILNSHFSEEDFFSSQFNNEVALIKNARYCPAFWHSLEFIKIVYVYAGSCTYYMKDEVIQLTQGSFCIVGPNVRQAVGSYKDGDMVINLLMRYSTFTESFLGLLTEQGMMSEFLWKMLYNQSENMALIYRGEKDERLQETIRELHREFELVQQASNLIRKSLLMVFCGQVLRYHGTELALLGGGKDKGKYHLPHILQYMRANMDTVTLPSLAEVFHMSEGYISRYIRTQSGQTFSYLLTQMRMSRAEEMLRNTDFSIDKIIETVGYTEKSHFYRTFSNRNGMSPMVYRKRYTIYHMTQL